LLPRSIETRIRVVSTIGEIARADWDALANPGWPGDTPLASLDPNSYCPGMRAADSTTRPAYNPFVSHDFLVALEASGCASAATGWLGQHLVLDGPDGKPAAAMPCYLKSHSQGEYVFDHGWADAYARAKGRYYPKLQASIPFTPVPGPRLLVANAIDAERARKALAAGGMELVKALGVSSLHATFLTEPEWQLLGAQGYLQRTDQQFHFVNDGYRDFDDFLEALSSRKRKAVKRERRDAVDGLEVVQLTGPDITESAWDAFFRFYMDTGSRKWGRPYLNRRFFSLIGELMADRILLVLARRGGDYVAGALNFIGSDTLYGRYWGTTIEQPFLHFELCYYQAIEWGLAHGLARVEAGAQGEHKLARGYRPTITYSAHYIADPAFRTAVADYLTRERREVSRDAALMSEFLPFREAAADQE
jgi:predicted N-acyltransferase